MLSKTIISGKLLTLPLLSGLICLTTACFTIVADDTRPLEQDTDLTADQPVRAISSSDNPRSPGQDNSDAYELYLIAYPEEGADFQVDPAPSSQGTYPAGTTVTIDVLPKPGWEIERWVGSVYAISGGIAKVRMEEDQTVLVRLVQTDQVPTSSFTSILAENDTSQPESAFTLTVNGMIVAGRFIELENGTVEVSPRPNGSGSHYLAGTTVELEAAAEKGFRFVGWEGDCSQRNDEDDDDGGKRERCRVTMNEGKRVVAIFARKE